MTQQRVTLYGLKSCDSCRKARTWLAQNGVAVHVHDVRRDGVTPQELQNWLNALGWQTLLNRRSTTWRELEPVQRTAVTDDASAQTLLLAHPSAIKRPVVQWPCGKVTVGFAPERWQELLAS